MISKYIAVTSFFRTQNDHSFKNMSDLIPLGTFFDNRREPKKLIYTSKIKIK